MGSLRRCSAIGDGRFAGGSCLLVRTQLAHDRLLHREQRRAEIAVKLGWALRGVTEGLGEIDGGIALSTERKWNGLSPVSDATYRAQISGLPDKDEAVRLAVGLARDMLWRWRSCVEFAETGGRSR